MHRFASGCVDDLGMEGCVLVGDVSIDGDTGVISLFRIHLASRFAAAARAVALASEEDLVPSPQCVASGMRC